MNLQEFALECIRDSDRWFGDTGAINLVHMVLSFCGEAGELANKVKKLDRGDYQLTTDVITDLGLEAIDAFIYLCNIFALLGVDPDALYEQKRKQNDVRFTERRRARETQSTMGQRLPGGSSSGH